MLSRKYGYVRVSTKEQNIDRQLLALQETEIPGQDIFIDRQTGKDFNRPKYRKLLKRLKPGDVVYVKSIDRLGRDYEEIIEQWRYLTKTKDIDIVVIDFPLLDTREQVNGITGKFISDMVLQVMCYVAQIERENILQRQAEGIKAAKEKGTAFGRPRLEEPEAFQDIYQRILVEELSKRQAAEMLNVSRCTITRWMEQHR